MVTAWFAAERSGAVKGSLLQGEVCVEIDLCRAGAFMAEPKCNDGDVDVGVEQRHGAGMTKGVR